jgi:multidrug efflux pump subunit AcrB
MQPEVRVRIDRPKAADLSVAVGAIAPSGRWWAGGGHEVQGGDEQYPVSWGLGESRRTKRSRACRFVEKAARPRNLVRLTEERSAAQIDRFNRSRQVTVVANFQGIHLKEGQDRLTEKVRALNFPADYSYAFIGRSKIYEQAIWGFFWATVTSMIFIYMVLAAQFNSYLHPVTIMACLPVSLPFGFLSLMLAGMTLNVYSMIGMLLLFGIIKKNSILQVDYTNTLRARGVPGRRHRRGEPRTEADPHDDVCCRGGSLIALGRGRRGIGAPTAMVIVGARCSPSSSRSSRPSLQYSLRRLLRAARPVEGSGGCSIDCGTAGPSVGPEPHGLPPARG